MTVTPTRDKPTTTASARRRTRGIPPELDPRQGALDLFPSDELAARRRPAPKRWKCTGPDGCTECEEAEHLLGADDLSGVAHRLGFRTAANLRVHLRRHGRAELVARYDALVDWRPAA